jgi:hypothetical protein
MGKKPTSFAKVPFVPFSLGIKYFDSKFYFDPFVF